MAPWPESELYPGDRIDARRARASWVGEAWFDGVAVFMAWPRADAGAILPPDWCLAAPRRPRADHPVALLIGRQRDTAVLFGGATWRTDIAYDEAALAVPFVRPRAGRSLHTWIPVMVSGDARATWSGNAHYGFNKRPGAVERFGRTIAVTGATGALLAAVTVHAPAAWAPARDAAVSAETAALRSLAALPIAGRRAGGDVVVSYFDWQLGDAVVRPASVSVAIAPELAGGAGVAGAPVEGSGRPGAHGVEVRRLRWRLSWPAPWRP